MKNIKYYSVGIFPKS